jgi:hypothetical protein
MTAESLSSALQIEHEQSMLRQAEMIQRCKDLRVREEHATIHIRQTLQERGLGRISEETKDRIYVLLSFALPRNNAYADIPEPLSGLDNHEAHEAFFHNP